MDLQPSVPHVSTVRRTLYSNVAFQFMDLSVTETHRQIELETISKAPKSQFYVYRNVKILKSEQPAYLNKSTEFTVLYGQHVQGAFEASGETWTGEEVEKANKDERSVTNMGMTRRSDQH